MITRPMKAATVTIEMMGKVEWPVYASPKIDGIRCLMHPELGPVSQKFKPIPNHHIRERLKFNLGNSDLDGELYAINDDGTALFNQTQSAVMSRDGQPNFRYAVFDCFTLPELDFASRYNQTMNIVKVTRQSWLKVLTHTVIGSQEEFIRYIDACIEDGYEGAVIRSFAGPYKSGRSTLNQNWMLKYTPWSFAEGIIIRFEELRHNENPKETDLLGLSKRSSHLAGKVRSGTLGALVLKTEWGELRVGTGFTAAQRQAIWDRNPGVWYSAIVALDGKAIPPGDIKELVPDMGRTVTFKYKRHGMQTLPRFPVFKGFRED